MTLSVAQLILQFLGQCSAVAILFIILNNSLSGIINRKRLAYTNCRRSWFAGVWESLGIWSWNLIWTNSHRSSTWEVFTQGWEMAIKHDHKLWKIAFIRKTHTIQHRIRQRICTTIIVLINLTMSVPTDPSSHRYPPIEHALDPPLNTNHAHYFHHPLLPTLPQKWQSQPAAHSLPLPQQLVIPMILLWCGCWYDFLWWYLIQLYLVSYLGYESTYDDQLRYLYLVLDLC